MEESTSCLPRFTGREVRSLEGLVFVLKITSFDSLRRGRRLDARCPGEKNLSDVWPYEFYDDHLQKDLNQVHIHKIEIKRPVDLLMMNNMLINYKDI